MSSDISDASYNTETLANKELDWNEIIQKQIQLSVPLLVKVCSADVSEDNAPDVKVGDKLYIHDITVEHVQLSLADASCNEDASNKNTIVIPVTFGGKYKPCPFYPPTHTFQSVREIMDVFPFVNDIIFPQEPITIEGTEIPAWEVLQVITLVQDTPSKQLLEINVVKRRRQVLLPAALEVKFLQWNRNWEEAALDRNKPRIYSLSELCEFWSPKLHPIRIEIRNEETSPARSPSKEAITKKRFVSKIFKGKDRKTGNGLSNEKTPVIDDETINEDYWMIPEKWRLQQLEIQPIHVVRCTNADTSAKFILMGEQKIKVVEILRSERSTSLLSSDGAIDDEDSPRSSRSWSETAVPAHQLDLMSLFGNKARNNAIVAVVCSGQNTTSRQSNAMTFGSWVALHRTRRVRKLLIVASDTQHFLVSAHYAGGFVRLPLIFDTAGEVPLNSESIYITRCTAYPNEKELDPCREGQFVRFQRQSTLTVNNVELQVVHCMVSSEKDGPQHAVSYPLNLRGRFEKFDDSPTEMTTQELFKRSLPLCAKVEIADSSLGFDPLAIKKTFMIKKVVSETTIIVEVLRKYEDCVKAGGVISEVPAIRGSLLLREVPTKDENPLHGVQPYPRKKEFKGLEKLPCVEVLSESDVADLQDDSRNLSVSSIISPTLPNKEVEQQPAILPKHIKLPVYATVNKINMGTFLPSEEDACETSPSHSDVNNSNYSPSVEEKKTNLMPPTVKPRRPISFPGKQFDSAKANPGALKKTNKAVTQNQLETDVRPTPAPRKRLLSLPNIVEAGQKNSLPPFREKTKTILDASTEDKIGSEISHRPSDQDSNSLGQVAFSSGEYASFQKIALSRNIEENHSVEKYEEKEKCTAKSSKETPSVSGASSSCDEQDYEDVEEEELRDYDDVEALDKASPSASYASLLLN